MDEQKAGTGYLALPEGNSGRAVLVLHSWWGLTPFFTQRCDALAAAGFVALAPDLFDGEQYLTIDDAEAHLAEVDANALAHVVRSSLHTLRGLPVTYEQPAGVVGFSMGASLAMWVAARAADDVDAVVAYYGAQDIDFLGTKAHFLGHFAERDDYVDEDALSLLDAELHMDGCPVEFHRYDGTEHWFAEDNRPEHHPEAAALAWRRTVAFLDEHLSR